MYEHREDKDYGEWLGFRLVEEIWKGSLRRLSERSRWQCNLITWWLLALDTQEMQ